MIVRLESLEEAVRLCATKTARKAERIGRLEEGVVRKNTEGV